MMDGVCNFLIMSVSLLFFVFLLSFDAVQKDRRRVDCGRLVWLQRLLSPCGYMRPPRVD